MEDIPVLPMTLMLIPLLRTLATLTTMMEPRYTMETQVTASSSTGSSRTRACM